MGDIISRIAGIEPGSRLAGVLAKRADVLELSDRTHDAALTPVDPGGLSHAERAAFACRIARLNDDSGFERHFEQLMDNADADDSVRRIAEGWFDGGGDARTRALIRHVDLVAHDPKSATKNDIALLKQAGISDADIVRLSELIALVSYQIRVVAGLKLMRAAT